MRMKISLLVKIVLAITILNTLLLGYLTYDKVVDTIKKRPIVISKDYDKGQSIELAMETKKPMVVLFYTDWCSYCQRFVPTFKKVVTNKEIKKNFMKY